MIRAQLLTPWTGSGASTADARRPLLADAYALASWADVTGTPSASLIPDPNLCVIEITCTVAVFAAIEADGAYADGILWSEEV